MFPVGFFPHWLFAFSYFPEIGVGPYEGGSGLIVAIAPGQGPGLDNDTTGYPTYREDLVNVH